MTYKYKFDLLPDSHIIFIEKHSIFKDGKLITLIVLQIFMEYHKQNKEQIVSNVCKEELIDHMLSYVCSLEFCGY